MLKDGYDFLSPEKVYLNLNLAGIGSRFAACFIDGIFKGLLLFFFFLLVLIPGSIVIGPKLESSFWGVVIAIVLIVIACVILVGYHFFFETIWNGQTPGKRFLKIRVVQENGASVTFLQVLIRNLLRIVDSLPTGYGVGIIAALISKKNQRLGDMAAGTVVVREIVEGAPAELNIEVIEMPWSGAAWLHIHEITEDEFAILKKYLLRQEKLSQKEAGDITPKLVAYFTNKLGLKPEEVGDSTVFLEQVAAMYRNRRS